MRIDIPPIIVDTREQTPWEFDHPTVVECLKTGDYSVQGLENIVVIERKRHNELVQCFTHGRERFERELQRGESLKFLHIIVEASLRGVMDGAYDDYPNQTHPAAIRGTILAWTARYPWVRFWFPGDREGAQLWAEHTLKRAWADHVQAGKQKEALKAA
jgi:ERCC4-type nuclease